MEELKPEAIWVEITCVTREEVDKLMNLISQKYEVVRDDTIPNGRRLELAPKEKKLPKILAIINGKPR
jgi:hypothetical protein